MNEWSLQYQFKLVNVLFLFFAIIVLVVAITLEISGFNGISKSGYSRYWLVSGLTFLISVTPPLFRMKPCQHAFKMQVWFGIATVLITLIVGGITISRIDTTSTAPIIFVVAIVTIFMGILGWFIHAHLSSNTSRKTLTFNMMMQSRLSAEYQQQERNWFKAYNSRTSITIEDLNKYHILSKDNMDCENENNRTKQEYISDKVEALRAARYLLNYYEFYAIGIFNNDLDEALIYSYMGGTILSTYKAAEEYIKRTKETQPKAFDNLGKLVNIWKIRKITKSNNASKNVNDIDI